MRSVKIKKLTRGLRGELQFPGDKSLSHRAIIFGSLAEGVSEFTNVSEGEDCVCTREAFTRLGVKSVSTAPGKLRIQGRGLRSLQAADGEIDCGNSGTSMRLLLGVLAGQPFECVLTGDPSLSARPMRRVTDYLRQMGAVVEGADNANHAPLKIRGGHLKGIDAVLPVASAQVKSAILLAGLYASGVTSVTQPVLSRDHTENFIQYFGARVHRDGLKVSVLGGQSLTPRSFEIPGDISSAAFFMAMAAVLPGSEIRFNSVLWNQTRTGVVEVLRRMGIEAGGIAVHESGPESAADFTIHAGGSPLPFEIKKQEIPALVDEIPILTVLATQARGVSVIHDAGELRVKETDRIHSMVETLSSMGARIRAEGNSIIVVGPTPLRGAHVSSFKDHRTALSLIVAGLIAEGQTVVEDIDCINTSFPAVFELLDRLQVPYQAH